MSRTWPHDRAHYFFARAQWDVDQLGLAVARLAVALLVPPGAPLEAAVDESLFRRAGRKVHGAGWQHDAASPSRVKTGYGTCFVTCGIIVQLPFCTRPVCLPVLARLMLPGKKKPGAAGTRVSIAVDLVTALAGAFPGRAVHVAADGAYHAPGSVLNNGLGRYEDAMSSAELASSYPEELGFSNWGLVELVEAAVRCGEHARAGVALERLASTTGPSGTQWGLGIEARSRALLSEGDVAERLYRECIKRLSSGPARAELARAACFTANGCAARAVVARRASSCAPPTRCWARWGWRGSPSGPAASCWPSARPWPSGQFGPPAVSRR